MSKAIKVTDKCPDDCPYFQHKSNSCDPEECRFALGYVPNYFPGPNCPLPDWPRMSREEIKDISFAEGIMVSAEELVELLRSKGIEVED